MKTTIKRPLSKLYARIFEMRAHPRYNFGVSVGFGYRTPKKHFITRAEAEAFCAELNTEENLLKHFRPWFRTEEETRAFLGLGAPQAEEPSQPPIAEPLPPPLPVLTPAPVRTMRAKPFSVKRYNNVKKPLLKYVVRGVEEGRYTSKFFRTEGEAKAYAELRNTEYLNQGRDALSMPSWLRVAATRCQARLEQFGKTVEDATSFYLLHLEQSEKSCTLSDLLAKMIDHVTRLGTSKKRVSCYKRNVGRLIAALGPKRLVCDITTKEISAFLESVLVGLAPKSRNDIRKLFVALFNFGKRQGYISGNNPASEATQFREIETPVGILAPEQVANLLEQTAGTPMLLYVAIGAFAGLRRAEIFRLDWSEIDLEENYIEVTAAKSKTASRRVVSILPCLREWLKPHAKLTGKVLPWPGPCPEAWEMLYNARRRAGIETWPNNALRHSFASYHLAAFNNASALALEMGHVNNSMIFQHYRKVVKKAAADRFWEIKPSAASEKIVEFRNSSAPEIEEQQVGTK